MVVSLADFSLIIAIHQIEMISFIKLFSCHSVFPDAAHAVEVSCSCWLILNSDEFLTFLKDFAWICVGVCSWDVDE